MNILLVDDEALQLKRLEESVNKSFIDIKTFSYTNPLKALEDNKNIKFNIAFLDIEMPGLNGIQLAKELKNINPLINIIFVTAYNDYALDAYKLHASGYITKPVNEFKIKEEVNNLRFPVEMKNTKLIQVKCFGTFDVFYKGESIKFNYSKSKELFAYLIDREGSSVNVNELNAVLWEEDHKSYLRNLISDIHKTLNQLGVGEVFIRGHNSYAVDVDKIDCDAYEYHRNNPDAIRMYRGEYMIQYSWPIFKANY